MKYDEKTEEIMDRFNSEKYEPIAFKALKLREEIATIRAQDNRKLHFIENRIEASASPKSYKDLELSMFQKYFFDIMETLGKYEREKQRELRELEKQLKTPEMLEFVKEYYEDGIGIYEFETYKTDNDEEEHSMTYDEWLLEDANNRIHSNYSAA